MYYQIVFESDDFGYFNKVVSSQGIAPKFYDVDTINPLASRFNTFFKYGFWFIIFIWASKLICQDLYQIIVIFSETQQLQIQKNFVLKVLEVIITVSYLLEWIETKNKM